MKKVAIAFMLVALAPCAVMGSAVLVSFKGGIGVDPISGATGTPLVPTLNIVRGIAPGGAPWVIASLKAEVDTDGHITAHGRGLVLAGGSSIGTPDGITSVEAMLFCGPANSATAFASGAVPLAADGDLDIEGALDSIPPDPCTDPVLLIVGATIDRWFAAGIPRSNGD